MSAKFIPYGKQWIDEEDIAAVVDVLRSDYLTTGPKIEEFEEKFAHYVGAKYAVSISNGTAALHAACFAAGIRLGDEVITTPITFAASANCILYCSGTPVFADIDEKTYNIDPVEIEKKITERTKAIIPVHYTGQPCDMNAIHRIAKSHNLLVIEDAAHALGAKYEDKKIGSLSDMTTFSFHPVKHIATGEGGMITTNNEILYKKLLLFRSHGIIRDIDLLENRNEGSWYYEQQDLGYNYRMTDIQAALGISQLKKLDDFLERRIEIAAMYNEAFRDIDEITIPYQADRSKSSWHLYVIKLNLDRMRIDRKEMFRLIQRERIGVNIHYIPVYYFPYYQKLGYEQGICPKSESFYESIITLPLFPKMSDEDILRIIKTIISLIEKWKIK